DCGLREVQYDALPDRARCRLPEMPGIQGLPAERRHRRLQTRRRSGQVAEYGRQEGRPVMRFLRRVCIGLFGIAVGSAALAQGGSTAASQNLSNASQASLAAPGFVVAGSSELIRSSAQLTVVAVQTVGESAVI